MLEGIEVAKVHGHTITYNADKKQFLARVGGREIKKSSQREVEKVISRFVRGGERTKGIILDYGWRSVHVLPIEIVSLRGRRIQYKKGDWMEGEDADKVYVHSDEVLEEAKKLEAEHDAWLKRWEGLLKRAKQIDPESLK